MIPLADVHCHLLAGLDDGPRTPDDALAMCRLARNNGTQLIAATAHQNEDYPDVTPDRIRQATQQLVQRLREANIDLRVFPCAEVMVHPEIEESWLQGSLLSIADRQQYILLEMPHGLFIDVCDLVRSFRQKGIQPVLAHPERQPELLHEPGQIEEVIRAGCLVQVSSKSVTHPKSSQDGRALKDWFKRGLVHLLGSDGHSLHRRPPVMADAYHQIARWAGSQTADRICSTNGMALLQGLPFRIPEPAPRRSWHLWFW